MARRGFLDYVLGGAVGGFEGLAQKRAADEEKARMAAALARQVRMDAMMMEDRAEAKEDRLEAQKDRLQTQRQRVLAGGYIPTGRDMPGAVERPFFDEQVIGGQTYRSYLTPGQFARKTAAEAAEFKAKFDPETMTPYQKEMIRQRTLDRLAREKASAGDGSDKVTRAGIDKAIAGAGKIVTASLNQEKMAETQLAALDRIRPDPNRFAGTNDQLVAAEAAWQKRVDAAQRRLEAAQEKTSRLSPTYEGSLVSRDTTGYGEAFGPPAAPAAPARQPTRTPLNPQEDALAKQASAMVQQWMKSGAPKEEISAAVSKINNRLANEIRALRSGGK